MKHLELRFDGGVATVTLNRPDVRNAFNDEVIAELTAVFSELGERGEVRCIVLAANGTAFCAGADLNWMKRMADYTRDENLADAAALADMLRVIYRCPKPTIARVQGDVYAGGIGLVAVCDIAVSRRHGAVLPERSEAGPDPGDDQPLCDPRDGRARGASLLPHRRALQRGRGAAHRLRARSGGGRRARRQGRASSSQALVQAGPAAVQGLQGAGAGRGGPRHHARADRPTTVQGIADIRASDEGREGVQAFLEKRKPGWLPES